MVMTTALLVLDAQRTVLEGAGAIPAATTVRAALADLLARARAAGSPVIHVQNDGRPGYPDEPGTAGWGLVFDTRPGELTLRKTASDTFAANDHLAETLRGRGIDHLVIAGMQSDYCVRATSRSALQAGFRVTIPSGAHATYDDEAPATDLARAVEEELAAEGVAIVPVEEVRF